MNESMQFRDDEPALIVKKITEIWENVLGSNEINGDANFFALGGHSLLAVQLVLKLESEFGIRIPLPTFFEHSTLNELTAIILEEHADHHADKQFPEKQVEKSLERWLSDVGKMSDHDVEKALQAIESQDE